MGKYDWATPDYLTDAIDAVERRAYRAEIALESRRDKIQRGIETAMYKLVSMGAAGVTAYSAYTIFSQNGKPHLPEVLGFGADAVAGVGLSLAAFFGVGSRIGLGEKADLFLDAAGTGFLDHWSVVAGQRAGAGALMASSGVKPPGVAGALGPANDTRQVGQGSPTDYMTPDQQRQWARFDPAQQLVA
jgi:hypothetical protein